MMSSLDVGNKPTTRRFCQIVLLAYQNNLFIENDVFGETPGAGRRIVYQKSQTNADRSTIMTYIYAGVCSLKNAQ